MTDRLIIDDSNWREHSEGGELAVGSFGCLRPKYRARAVPEFTFADIQIPLIPESEWGDRIRAKDAAKSWLKDLTYEQDSLDQDGRGQCHLYGNCGAFRTLTTKQGGIPRCPSAQALAWNTWDGRSWGNRGADPADSFETLIAEGAARDSIWPMDGDGQSSRYNTDAAQADALNMRLVRGVELGHEDDIWREVISCVLQNIPCSAAFNWWGHHVEMPWAGLKGTEVCSGGRNSWGNSYADRGFFLLSGSRKRPSAAWAFVEATYSP